MQHQAPGYEGGEGQRCPERESGPKKNQTKRDVFGKGLVRMEGLGLKAHAGGGGSITILSGFFGVPSPATVNLDFLALLFVASVSHAVEAAPATAVGVPGIEGSSLAVSAGRTLSDIFLQARRRTKVSAILEAAMQMMERRG